MGRGIGSTDWTTPGLLGRLQQLREHGMTARQAALVLSQEFRVTITAQAAGSATKYYRPRQWLEALNPQARLDLPGVNWRLPGRAKRFEELWATGMTMEKMAKILSAEWKCSVTKSSISGYRERSDLPGRGMPQSITEARRRKACINGQAPNEPATQTVAPTPTPTLTRVQRLAYRPAGMPPAVTGADRSRFSVLGTESFTTCQWMHGDVRDRRFCEAPVDQVGCPYCTEHRARAYEPVRGSSRLDVEA